MKKRISDRKKTPGSFKLYRNDIEEILALLDEYAYTKTLSDSQYEYDDLDDLEKARGITIRDFTITGTGLGTKFKLSISAPIGSILEVTNKDEFYLLLIDFLKKKKRIALGVIIHLFSALSIIGFFVLPR